MNIDAKKLSQKLKMSRLTPADYTPSDEFLNTKSIVVTIDEIPVLAVGNQGSKRSLAEARAIIDNSEICNTLALALNKDINSSFSIKIMDSFEVIKGEFSAIASKTRGVIEDGRGDGDLIWIVLAGENSLPLATALSISNKVDHIVYEMETWK